MFVGIEWFTLLACVSSVFLGGVVQGFFGYGLGLLVLPALAILEPRSLPQVILLLGFPSVAWMAFHERRSRVLDGVRPLLLGRLLGTAIGLIALFSLAENLLTIGFGLVTIGMVAGTGLSRVPIEINARNNLLAGTFSGIMGTTAGVGGTPIAMLYSRRLASEMRSTLSVVLLLGSTMSLIGITAIGRIRAVDLILTLLCFPALIVGMGLSSWLVKQASPSVFRALLLTVSAVSGLVVILSAVM